MTNPASLAGDRTSVYTNPQRRFFYASLTALFCFANACFAQTSTVAIKMVPVTLILPQLQFTSPLGTSNVVEVSTNLTSWQDVTTLQFINTNVLTWLDTFPRNQAFYRLRRLSSSGGGPPFPAPTTNLVWIPAGSFVMGSPNADPDAFSEEQPETTVTLTRGFFMGKFEVTQGQYIAIVGNNPSSFQGETNRPVDNISWTAATNFCRLLNISEANAGRLPSGYAYRLPTEAEWEYAARAGSASRFNWGDDLGYTALGNHAWYSANSAGTTQPVGQKLPNSWGLYDTAGNVCEWVQDSFVTYPGGSVTNPVPSNASANKVFRGGSHADDAVSCRPAQRKFVTQTQALNIFGLRVVLASTAPN
jgi:formylglycine-generating enzyme required for sulfatase activity